MKRTQDVTRKKQNRCQGGEGKMANGERTRKCDNSLRVKDGGIKDGMIGGRKSCYEGRQRWGKGKEGEEVQIACWCDEWHVSGVPLLHLSIPPSSFTPDMSLFSILLFSLSPFTFSSSHFLLQISVFFNEMFSSFSAPFFIFSFLFHLSGFVFLKMFLLPPPFLFGPVFHFITIFFLLSFIRFFSFSFFTSSSFRSFASLIMSWILRSFLLLIFGFYCFHLPFSNFP